MLQEMKLTTLTNVDCQDRYAEISTILDTSLCTSTMKGEGFCRVTIRCLYVMALINDSPTRVTLEVR
jgi:hypothetical protein